MFFIELICFIFIIIYIIMGIYSYHISQKSMVNRVYFSITILFSTWTLAALIRNVYSSQEIIYLWRLMSAIAWTIGTSAILHFSVALINENKLISKMKQLLIYVPALLLLVGNLFILFNEENISHNSFRILNIIFNAVGRNIYYLLYTSITCYLLLKWSNTTGKMRQKKQGRIISFSLIITAILIIIYGTILPLMVDFVLPFVLPLIPMIWVSSMWIAITKYRLMSFRPIIAITEIMDNVLDIIVLSNSQGEIIEVNKRAEEILKYKKKELIEKKVIKLIDSNHEINTINTVIEEILFGNIDMFHNETEFFLSDNTTIPVRVRITSVKDNFKEVIGLVLAAQDLRMEKQFEVMSITDKLTQVYNRLKLDEVMEYEIKRSKRNGRVFSIILIDIDDFKMINDDFGHQIGDQVLIEITQVLIINIRDVDVLGRWGGEEFLIILQETSIEKTLFVAEKLREKIANKDFGINRSVTCSL